MSVRKDYLLCNPDMIDTDCYSLERYLETIKITVVEVVDDWQKVGHIIFWSRYRWPVSIIWEDSTLTIHIVFSAVGSVCTCCTSSWCYRLKVQSAHIQPENTLKRLQKCWYEYLCSSKWCKGIWRIHPEEDKEGSYLVLNCLLQSSRWSSLQSVKQQLLPQRWIYQQQTHFLCILQNVC